jgi:hypothetical protein
MKPPTSKAQWRYFLDDLKRVRAGEPSRVGMTEAELEEALRTPYASLPDRAEGVKKKKTFLDRINPPKRRTTFVHHILAPIRRGVVDVMDI